MREIVAGIDEIGHARAVPEPLEKTGHQERQHKQRIEACKAIERILFGGNPLRPYRFGIDMVEDEAGKNEKEIDHEVSVRIKPGENGREGIGGDSGAGTDEMPVMPEKADTDCGNTAQRVEYCETIGFFVVGHAKENRK